MLVKIKFYYNNTRQGVGYGLDDKNRSTLFIGIGTYPSEVARAVPLLKVGQPAWSFFHPRHPTFWTLQHPAVLVLNNVSK